MAVAAHDVVLQGSEHAIRAPEIHQVERPLAVGLLKDNRPARSRRAI